MDISIDTTISNNLTLDSQQQKIIEQLQQELFNAKKTAHNEKLCRGEMEMDLEKLYTKVQETENENTVYRSEIVRYKEKIDTLNIVLEEERDHAKTNIDELKEALEVMELNKVIQEQPTECDLLKDEILTLKDELTGLKKKLAESESESSKIMLLNSQFISKIKELEEDLKSSQEILKMKNETLQSTLEAFEELKNEKALMSSELAVLKAGPLENNARGNSLFSEVDIKRQVTERKIERLRNKYIQLRKDYIIQTDELERVKSQNRKIKISWEDEDKHIYNKEYELLESYRKTNVELRGIIRDLEMRPESPKIVTLSDSDLSNMDWVHSIINKCREEAKEYRRKYEDKGCDMLSVEENDLRTRWENKDLKVQAMKNKALIEELETKLAAIEKKNSTVVIDETLNIKTENKENDVDNYNEIALSKAVRFTDKKPNSRMFD